MHRRILCGIVLGQLLVARAVFCQGYGVHGMITDSLSGERIPFANVGIVDSHLGAVANLQGFYMIRTLRPGSFEVVASAVGYARKSIRLTIGTRDSNNVLDFRLRPEAVEMPEVTITSGGKRELTEIGTSVHVMNQSDIHAVPVSVQDDIFKAIQIIPGIVSASDVNSHFYVRGGAGDQNLILLDGMKIYNPFHAVGVFSLFDADLIKTTEVYTGAFPPGYGGRLSSVVTMTTRDGSSTGFRGRANVNFLSSKLSLEGPILDNVTMLMSGRKSIFPQTLKKFFGRDVPVSFYDYFMKVNTRPDMTSWLSVEGFLTGDDLKGTNPDDPDYRWRNRSLAFIGSGLILEHVFAHFVAYDNSYEARRDAKPLTSVTSSSTSINEFGVRGELTAYATSGDQYFFGMEFSFPQLRYSLVNTLGIPLSPNSSSVDSWFWVRYLTKLWGMDVDAGIHTDMSSIIVDKVVLSSIQPRVNLSYPISETWRLKLGYGQFTQKNILVNNEDDVISLFDAWIQVPPALQSEHATHLVIGAQGYLAPELSASFQTYYKNYDRLVTYNRDKVDASDPDYVKGSGISYGVESIVRYGLFPLDLYAAYTLGWTTIVNGGVTYPPRYDRRHSLNLLGVVHAGENLDVSARWEYGSGFPFSATIGYFDELKIRDIFNSDLSGETGIPYTIIGSKNGERLPAYHRLDLGASYRMTVGGLRGSLGANIVNVYDRKNLLYFDRSTGKERQMLRFFPSASFTLEF